MLKLLIIGYFCFAVTVGVKAKGGSNKETRIVLGGKAREDQFPYQAFIIIGKFQCGGSIISKNVILSAAHCFKNVTSEQIKVYLGSNKIGHGDSYSAEKIIIHEDFIQKNTTMRNDIALVKLKKDITFKDNVRKIDLETNEVGEVDAIVSGWGRTDHFGIFVTNYLRYFKTKTISLEECRLQFRPLKAIDDKHICTETSFGGTCDGDSGGPLVSNEKQIGIVSFLLPIRPILQCYSNKPRVYVKVSSYVKWINSKLEQFKN